MPFEDRATYHEEGVEKKIEIETDIPEDGVQVETEEEHEDENKSHVSERTRSKSVSFDNHLEDLKNDMTGVYYSNMKNSGDLDLSSVYSKRAW